jgi:hypothetical protein
MQHVMKAIGECPECGICGSHLAKQLPHWLYSADPIRLSMQREDRNCDPISVPGNAVHTVQNGAGCAHADTVLLQLGIFRPQLQLQSHMMSAVCWWHLTFK